MPANNPDHPKPIEISGIQTHSAGFCFLPDDATDIKAALKRTKVAQRRLINAKMHSAVQQSLNKKPVHFVDFIEILKALFKPRENFDNQSIAVLKEGKTIETLLGIDKIEGPLNINDKICFKKDSLNRKFFCLSNESILHINALLYKNDILEITDLLSKTDASERYLRRFLEGRLVPRDSFLKLLNLLAEEGVIQKPEPSFRDPFDTFPLKQDHFKPTRKIKGIQRILLKQNASKTINDILKKKLTHDTIADQAGIIPQRVHDFLSGGAKTIDPENLKKILHVLIENTIITLPDGTDVDRFVAGVAAMEPSFPERVRTAAACAASAGPNSNSQAATLAAAAHAAQGQSAGS